MTPAPTPLASQLEHVLDNDRVSSPADDTPLCVDVHVSADKEHEKKQRIPLPPKVPDQKRMLRDPKPTSPNTESIDTLETFHIPSDITKEGNDSRPHNVAVPAPVSKDIRSSCISQRGDDQRLLILEQLNTKGKPEHASRLRHVPNNGDNNPKESHQKTSPHNCQEYLDLYVETEDATIRL